MCMGVFMYLFFVWESRVLSAVTWGGASPASGEGGSGWGQGGAEAEESSANASQAGCWGGGSVSRVVCVRDRGGHRDTATERICLPGSGAHVSSHVHSGVRVCVSVGTCIRESLCFKKESDQFHNKITAPASTLASGGEINTPVN